MLCTISSSWFLGFLVLGKSQDPLNKLNQNKNGYPQIKLTDDDDDEYIYCMMMDIPKLN